MSESTKDYPHGSNTVWYAIEIAIGAFGIGICFGISFNSWIWLFTK